MKDPEMARWVLGMRLNQNEKSISLDQSRFATELIQKIYYSSSPIHTTSIDSGAVAILEDKIS